MVLHGFDMALFLAVRHGSMRRSGPPIMVYVGVNRAACMEYVPVRGSATYQKRKLKLKRSAPLSRRNHNRKLNRICFRSRSELDPDGSGSTFKHSDGAPTRRSCCDRCQIYIALLSALTAPCRAPREGVGPSSCGSQEQCCGLVEGREYSD